MSTTVTDLVVPAPGVPISLWEPGEGERVAAEQFPAVISYRLWRSRFGASPQTIGSRTRVKSQWSTVVGVAAQEFRGMGAAYRDRRLAAADPVRATNDYAARLVNIRQDASVMMFGGLKPGVAAS